MNPELLHAYFDGALDADQTAEVERALAAEPSLRAQLDTIGDVDGALTMLGEVEVDDAFTDRVMRGIHVDGALDLLPGHEATPGFAERVVRATRRRGLLLRLGVPIAAAAAAVLIAVVALRDEPDPSGGPDDVPVAEYRWEVDTEVFDSLDLHDLEDEILNELEAT